MARKSKFFRPAPGGPHSRADRLAEFCTLHGILLPQNEDWRYLDDQRIGDIIGVPSLRGRLCITNGVHAYMLREDNTVELVHLEWFRFDNGDRGGAYDLRPSSTARREAQAARVAKWTKLLDAIEERYENV